MLTEFKISITSPGLNREVEETRISELQERVSALLISFLIETGQNDWAFDFDTIGEADIDPGAIG